MRYWQTCRNFKNIKNEKFENQNFITNITPNF